MQLTFNVGEMEYEVFKSQVGHGNMSLILRNFVKSYSNEDTNYREATLRKKFDILKDEKDKKDKEFNKIKSKLDKIETERKMKELKELEEAKKMAEEKAYAKAETGKTFLSEKIPKM